MYWKKNENVEVEQIEGKTLLFDVDKFKFYEFNETMTFIWDLLKQPMNEESIIKELMSEYAIDKEIATKDVKDLLKQLCTYNLIQNEKK